MISLALLALLQAEPAASPSPSPSASARPSITIQTATAPGLTVSYLTAPWGPLTFAAMERAQEGFYNRRTWPFARLESTRALSVNGTALPPGNYALVFHPNTPDNAGMGLEIRKIAPGEFLQTGNVMTATPEGETVWQGRIHFDAVDTTEPALRVELKAEAKATRLVVRYGDRRLERLLSY
jgi:hypothetical protein